MPAPAKKNGADLALVFGSSPKGEDEDMAETESDPDEVSPVFEAAAVEAFPDLDGSPERIAAFKRAVMACMDSY